MDTQEEVHLHECIADQHFKCWVEYELKMSDEGSQERILITSLYMKGSRSDAVLEELADIALGPAHGMLQKRRTRVAYCIHMPFVKTE